ncbi:1-phosphofructokinase [Macrococcus equi]|uniref:1-phosphofructokinase n=1 Tax=Macrococcus equi TaxID=3395462 RepID=UPI0039BE124B
MIYTITLNPSIDYVVFTDQFKVGDLNRATSTFKFAGGKGINVSRVLKTLDEPSTALGFTGGFPGAFIKQTLETSGINTQFIQVEEDTRINIKLKGVTETEINAPGPKVSDQHLSALLSQLEQLTQEDFVIIAGSVPSSIQLDIYAVIAETLSKHNVPFVVDAEKSLLTQTLKHQPLFVKPNKAELEAMFDVQINNDQDTIDAARQLQHQGAQNVLVSLGGEGAILVTKDACYKAVVPEGKVINTVGSGDSTVAGMVAGFSKGKNIKDSLKQAVACGTATAFTEDLATREQIDAIINNITITKI